MLKSKFTFLAKMQMFQGSISMNFSTKMLQTATKNKKDSAGRRLGVKKFDGKKP